MDTPLKITRTDDSRVRDPSLKTRRALIGYVKRWNIENPTKVIHEAKLIEQFDAEKNLPTWEFLLFQSDGSSHNIKINRNALY